MTFAQFVMLTPFPGTVDFEKWEREAAKEGLAIEGVPITRHWLIPQANRPKVYSPHPVMSSDEIRKLTQGVWDRFYSLPRIWARSRAVESLRARVAFVLISKLYRQMYANTGIATDSARTARSCPHRPAAGQALPAAVCRQAHARPAGTRVSGTGGSRVAGPSIRPVRDARHADHRAKDVFEPQAVAGLDPMRNRFGTDARHARRSIPIVHVGEVEVPRNLTVHAEWPHLLQDDLSSAFQHATMIPDQLGRANGGPLCRVTVRDIDDVRVTD